MWESVKDCVCRAAKIVQGVRSVGWDITVTDNNEVEFIEGNSYSNIDLPQAVDQIGKRYIYDPEITAIAEKKRNSFPSI